MTFRPGLPTKIGKLGNPRCHLAVNQSRIQPSGHMLDDIKKTLWATADKLRANPLGVFVNAINWSKEMG